MSQHQDEMKDPQLLLQLRLPAYRHNYTPRDLCLYALGVGCGAADLRQARGSREPLLSGLRVI
jgi:hypothetical protein